MARADDVADVDHMAEAYGPVGIAGGAHADIAGIGGADGGFGIHCGGEFACGDGGGNHLVQPIFHDGRATGVDRVDPAGQDVDGGDLMAIPRKAGS